MSPRSAPTRFFAGHSDGPPCTVSQVESYDDDLRFAHVLAGAADDITTKRFRALDLRVETKPDLTPVSDADRATEDSLRNILRRSRPRDAHQHAAPRGGAAEQRAARPGHPRRGAAC